MWISLLLSALVGVLDGFGLAMFLPLIQFVAGQEGATNVDLGSMSFLLNMIRGVGLEVTLISVLSLMTFFFFLKGIALFSQKYYAVVVQQFYVRNLRLKSAKYLANYDYMTFSKADAGRIQNTMSGEIGRVATSFKSYVLAIQSWAMLMVYIGMAIVVNPQFAILVVIGGGVSNFLYRIIYKKTMAESRKITKKNHNFQGLIIQTVSFFKYLKATGFINTYTEKLLNTIKSIERHNKAIGFYNSVLSATREPLVILIISVVILIQVSFFNSALSGIILSLLLFYRALNSLAVLQNSWNAFLNVVGSLENVIEFEDELITGQEAAGGESFNNSIRSIRLENIQFSYEDSKVINDLSLRVENNSTIAFIGESGSGKTTLVNIISGLIKPEKGRILINDQDLKGIEKRSFQKRFGYVTQESIMFSDTIFNNVTLWSEKTPENIQKFWSVIDKTSCREFIEFLENKEESLLGNNGLQLSGGQKQRLCIARELYKNIDILILDEATSALDMETETFIQQSIDKIKGDYTIIIIAHRLATIKNADKIYLLSKGKIKESGSFADLMDKSPKFSQMISLSKS